VFSRSHWTAFFSFFCGFARIWLSTFNLAIAGAARRAGTAARLVRASFRAAGVERLTIAQFF
jgi:F0F1-type ATP synthase assembly protein I